MPYVYFRLKFFKNRKYIPMTQNWKSLERCSSKFPSHPFPSASQVSLSEDPTLTYIFLEILYEHVNKDSPTHSTVFFDTRFLMKKVRECC